MGKTMQRAPAPGVVRALDVLAGEQAATGDARQGGRAAERVPAMRSARGHKLVKQQMQPLNEVVHVDQSLDEAAVRMRDAAVPFLPVVDGDEIVGVLTAQDLSAAPQQTERGIEPAKARDRLSTDVAFCFEDDDVEAARAVAEESGHRRILVVDRDGYLVGLITLEGVLAATAGPRPGAGAMAARRHVKTPGRAKGEKRGRLVVYGVKPRIKR